ncbi:Extracellular Matrix protein PelA [hydrothermal vent metagenome]|uniref:Extracellular Matrix protein PelA n=1 Tax=hydrothermal vent metagenome TaxID=652676 RepID=A0A1W1BXZ9_9ZZZZ
MRFVIAILFFITTLFANLEDKSAIVYYGKDISYPLVGIHDYIIVQPDQINTYTHGFSLYKNKMYAYVSIGELDRDLAIYKDINASWIKAENKAWKSDALDITNKAYQEFIFSHQIESQIKRGFKNFFFDTLDSYYLYSKTTLEQKRAQDALVDFINEFHKRYPDARLVINRGFDIIDRVHNSITAVLFESYYKGLNAKDLSYKTVSDKDREWLDYYLDKIKSYNLDIIAVDYTDNTEVAKQTIQKLQKKGFIPYVADKHLITYGQSSKNAIKREILTLTYAPQYDIIVQEAHEYGALPLEYLGYIQKLYRIEKQLPKLATLQRYAGIVIWLRNHYPHPKKLLKWINAARKTGIKIAIVGNFGFDAKKDELKSLGIYIHKNKQMPKRSILKEDPMIGYEIMPSMAYNSQKIICKACKPLLQYSYEDNSTSTPAAITPWGGYLVEEAYITDINKENLWVVNPFQFFAQALRLQKLPVADPTTENGKRLFFSHVDGDGIMNRVEGNFGTFSGDALLNHIFKKYPLPISVSVIGAEIDPQGLYPKLSPKLIKIAKQIFALPNIEPASHTFTHTFFWGKIHNGTLEPKYRLKPKGYKYSLKRELKTTLDNINTKYIKPNKKPKAKTIFWSGDCAPRVNALDFIYKHHILAINGGDTTIQNTSPWLTLVAPFGLKRGDYYQIYTGAQNENVFTNDWLGPFWGFKRVTQTFKLTNSPRRLKPIDVYFHLYSGSKQASLEALKYVFDWAMKQDTMPIFTSEYIPKVMDMYEVSVAHEKNRWLFSGMRDLKTIRFEDYNGTFDLSASKNIAGFSHFENHTYVSLGTQDYALITTAQSLEHKQAYMLEANGKLAAFEDNNQTKIYKFKGYMPLYITAHVPAGCQAEIQPNPYTKTLKNSIATFKFRKAKEATMRLECH